MKKAYVLIIICCVLILCTAIYSLNGTYAQRGCCSHHGGQNYCDASTGKWVCNDNTYSPTCTCGSETIDNTYDTIEPNTHEQYENNELEQSNDSKDHYEIIPFIIIIIILYLLKDIKLLKKKIKQKIINMFYLLFVINQKLSITKN